MISSKKKIILFIFIVLMVFPPFFSGGRGAFVGAAELIFIALAFLLFGETDEVGGNKEDGNFFSAPLFFLLLFLIFSLIAVFFSYSPYESFAAWLRYLSWAALFFIAAELKFKKKEIYFLIKVFLGISVALSLVGMYFYLTGGYSRLTSTFYWPNPFAGYLLFSLPLALYLFLESGKGLKEKLLPGLVLILLISSFVLTGSRGAFLSFLSVLPVFFYFYNKLSIPQYSRGINNEKLPQPPFDRFDRFGKLRTGKLSARYLSRWRPQMKKFFAGFALILLCSVILITGINFLKQDGFKFAVHAKNGFGKSDFSVVSRLNYWRGAWDIFKDYPIFGSGLGTFGIIYPQYQKNPESAGIYAHNLYLEMLSETGIFVLLFFLLFLASVYWRARDALKEKKYALPLFVGILAFLIHNGVDIDWHFGTNTLIFWMFLGIFYGAAKHKSGEHNQKSFKATAVFISALLLISGIIFLYADYYFNQGSLLQARGELALAETAFGKSVLFNPNPKYLRQYGIILYTRGIGASGGDREELLGEALKISRKAVRLDGADALNYELRGKILKAQGEFKAAENDFREAVKLNRFKPRYYINLAELLISQNRTEDARETINKILPYYSEKTVRNREGRIMKGQEEFSGVKKEINYLKYLLSVL